MTKLDPLALAQSSADDNRPGVQPVTWDMIFNYVHGPGELHLRESAHAFTTWLNSVWFEFAQSSNGEITNGEVINGALADWRGNV